MAEKDKQLVSIFVLTYNSDKTVLETLESIKAQTYQNIELIISDDCSMDNTVEVCREWVAQNRERFVRTEILTVGINTGVSANGNRAKAACQGEWIKGIAGDDMLTPNCIQDCMNYITEHPDTVYLFGRCVAFGGDAQTRKYVERTFDYSFFELSKEKQLERLLFGENCIPASTAFYNRLRVQEIGVNNDERILLLEDWPKWINLLRAGVKLHFLDKLLVMYRVGNTLSTKAIPSVRYYECNRLFFFLYQAPAYGSERYEELYKRIIKEEMEVYRAYYDLNHKYEAITHSHAYKIGLVMMTPIKWFKKVFWKK